MDDVQKVNNCIDFLYFMVQNSEQNATSCFLAVMVPLGDHISQCSGWIHKITVKEYRLEKEYGFVNYRIIKQLQIFIWTKPVITGAN
jgi:hypothetical protein